jgi:hypothetical protein
MEALATKTSITSSRAKLAGRLGGRFAAAGGAFRSTYSAFSAVLSIIIITGIIIIPLTG